MRGLTVLVLLLSGCSSGSWIDSAFRQRDERVAAVFDAVADQVEDGSIGTGKPVADAVNRRLAGPEIDEPMSDVRAWLGERSRRDDTASALRSVAASRRRSSEGREDVFPIALAGLVGFAAGGLLVKMRGTK